jgi:hypothetical protein
MNFAELQIGDYFHIPGMSSECVYRKASSSQCSQNTLLQPIRPGTEFVQLTNTEITTYFATKREYIQNLKPGNYT